MKLSLRQVSMSEELWERERGRERQRERCCSVTKLCPTLCDPMDCSMLGSSVLHYFPEFAQIHVGRWAYAAISPSFTSFSSCLSHIHWRHLQVPSWVKLLLIVHIKQYWEPVNYNINFCSRKILLADLSIEIYIWIHRLTDLKSGNDFIDHLIFFI